jgi:hypothetical protein
MANRLETMVIETDRIEEAAALIDVVLYVLRAQRIGGDGLVLQEKEIIGLEYLLEDVQVVLGQGRSE